MIAIRAATSRDARAIAEVHVASWRWAYRDVLSVAILDAPDVDERERSWVEWLGGSGSASQTLVTERDGRVVGFCGFGPSRDEDAHAETGEVYTIYLLQDQTGRGVGRALFARANERLQALGYRRATLWVQESNGRTRRFYEAAGWSLDGSSGVHEMLGETLPILRYRVDLASP